MCLYFEQKNFIMVGFLGTIKTSGIGVGKAIKGPLKPVTADACPHCRVQALAESLIPPQPAALVTPQADPWTDSIAPVRRGSGRPKLSIPTASPALRAYPKNPIHRGFSAAEGD